MSNTFANNTITTTSGTTTYIPTITTPSQTITTSGFIDVGSGYQTYPFFPPAPSYKFEFASPVTKRLAFLRMPCGFSKHDLFNKLGHLPDDLYIVNSWHDTLSNSIIFMMTSDKFLVCEEGTTLPEIIVENETWDYKTRAEFAKRVEEINK